MNIDISI